MVKRLLSALSVIMLCIMVNAQVTTEPAFIQKGYKGQIIVTFNPAEGNGGMVGATACYAHTGLITSKSEPVFGGVYKLCAIEKEDGTIIPKIKISENTAKITNPHFKKVYRLFDNESGKALADELCVFDEVIDDRGEHTIFDPNAIWKTKTLTNFTAKDLHVPIFLNGKCVYESPTLFEIQKYCEQQVELLWDEVKRFENPHTYYVDLSKKLWDVKRELLEKA